MDTREERQPPEVPQPDDEQDEQDEQDEPDDQQPTAIDEPLVIPPQDGADGGEGGEQDDEQGEQADAPDEVPADDPQAAHSAFLKACRERFGQIADPWVHLSDDGLRIWLTEGEHGPILVEQVLPVPPPALTTD